MLQCFVNGTHSLHSATGRVSCPSALLKLTHFCKNSVWQTALSSTWLYQCEGGIWISPSSLLINPADRHTLPPSGHSSVAELQLQTPVLTCSGSAGGKVCLCSRLNEQHKSHDFTDSMQFLLIYKKPPVQTLHFSVLIIELKSKCFTNKSVKMCDTKFTEQQ